MASVSLEELETRLTSIRDHLKIIAGVLHLRTKTKAGEMELKEMADIATNFQNRKEQRQHIVI